MNIQQVEKDIVVAKDEIATLYAAYVEADDRARSRSAHLHQRREKLWERVSKTDTFSDDDINELLADPLEGDIFAHAEELGMRYEQRCRYLGKLYRERDGIKTE